MQMALYFFYLCLFYACYVCLLKTSFVITNCSSPDLWPWWKFKFGPSNVDFENPCYRQTHTRVNLWTSRNIGLIESEHVPSTAHMSSTLFLYTDTKAQTISSHRSKNTSATYSIERRISVNIDVSFLPLPQKKQFSCHFESHTASECEL